MAKIPAKVESRIKEALKRYQPLVEQAKARDVGEADTSTLVKDILADLFGYDKYSEITAEYQIKSTYCDLAMKVDGKLTVLVEVKSLNTDLKEQHVKQAVDYAANQGVADDEALAVGMAQKSAEFKEKGAEIYNKL